MDHFHQDVSVAPWQRSTEEVAALDVESVGRSDTLDYVSLIEQNATRFRSSLEYRFEQMAQASSYVGDRPERGKIAGVEHRPDGGFSLGFHPGVKDLAFFSMVFEIGKYSARFEGVHRGFTGSNHLLEQPIAIPEHRQTYPPDIGSDRV